MKKIKGILLTIVLLALLCSGILSEIADFALWLFKLKEATKDLSPFWNIVVRILTFGISFSLVGGIFNLIGLFNSKIMSVAYIIISTIVGFLLSYIVWKIEQHIVVILIVFVSIMFLAAIYFTIIIVKNLRGAKENGKAWVHNVFR